jgi:hypothetical protein
MKSLPAYCSHGQYALLSQGHCCKRGEYYDSVRDICVEAMECGFDPEDECPYDPQFTEPWIYANHPGCVSGRLSCCKNVSWAGKQGNYKCPITIWEGSGTSGTQD